MAQLFSLGHLVMIKSETLFWILMGAQAVFAIYLGISKLGLLFACPLALATMLIPLYYGIQIFGGPEPQDLLLWLIGGFIPLTVRRIKQDGSLLPRDPKGKI